MPRPKISSILTSEYAPEKFDCVTAKDHTNECDLKWTELAYAIIRQAVQDWRDLMTQSDDPFYSPKSWTCAPTSIAILRDFFRSEWCDRILCGFSINGRDILEQLEHERDAIKDESERKYAELQEVQRRYRDYQHGNG